MFRRLARNSFRGIDFTSLSLIIFVLVPCLRTFSKYVPGHSIEFAIIIFSSLVIFYYAILCSGSMGRLLGGLLSSRWTMIILFASMAIVMLVLYPIADGLKAQMRGSDQDDCVIMGIQSLFSGINPYIKYTYYNNPCSTGPGLFLVYAPFVLAGYYILGTVAAILAFALCLLVKGYVRCEVNIFLCLLMLDPGFWELAIPGSDLIAIGCGFAILAEILPDVINNRRWSHLVIVAIMCGLFSSSRINFLIVIPLLSLFVGVSWLRGAAIFFAVSACVGIVPGLAIYLWDPAHFTPLHLIGKSQMLEAPWRQLAEGLSVLGALYSVYRLRTDPSFLPTGFLISLAPSIVAISLAHLIVYCHGILADWEGANYIMPLIPLAWTIIMSRRHGIVAGMQD